MKKLLWLIVIFIVFFNCVLLATENDNGKISNNKENNYCQKWIGYYEGSADYTDHEHSYFSDEDCDTELKVRKSEGYLYFHFTVHPVEKNAYGGHFRHNLGRMAKLDCDKVNSGSHLSFEWKLCKLDISLKGDTVKGTFDRDKIDSKGKRHDVEEIKFYLIEEEE